jgi:hypothetical protein
MNRFLQGVFNHPTLAYSGVVLIVLGSLIWNLPRMLAGTLAERRDFSARLRSVGEGERAAKVDAGTDLFQRRVPIFGSVMVVLGVASILGGWLMHG